MIVSKFGISWTPGAIFQVVPSRFSRLFFCDFGHEVTRPILRKLVVKNGDFSMVKRKKSP